MSAARRPPVGQDELHLDLPGVGLNAGSHRLVAIELRGGGLVLSLLAQPHHPVHSHSDEDTNDAKDNSAASTIMRVLFAYRRAEGNAHAR